MMVETREGEIVKIKETDGIRVGPGEVYAADPCYAFGPEHDPAWSDFVATMFRGPKVKHGILVYGQAEILFTQTAYGDGHYPINGITGQSKTPVDAGLVAVAEAEGLKKTGLSVKDRYTGTIDREKTVRADGEGNLMGDIEIITEERR